MAIREIRQENDDILRKISRKVEIIDDRILNLLDDMSESMYKANGCGLAAPQVGILRRVIVVDTGEGLIEVINPVIVYESGEQVGSEGCLSVLGRVGEVTRPKKIILKGLNRYGEPFEETYEDFLAVVFSHEVDHLNGILYIDKARNIKSAVDSEE